MTMDEFLEKDKLYNLYGDDGKLKCKVADHGKLTAAGSRYFSVQEMPLFGYSSLVIYDDLLVVLRRHFSEEEITYFVMKVLK